MLFGTSHHLSQESPHDCHGALEQFLFHSQKLSEYSVKAFPISLDRKKKKKELVGETLPIILLYQSLDIYHLLFK